LFSGATSISSAISKELVCNLADGTDTFASNVGEVVEALLKFAATILFRRLG
jgi:hypothetical protein